MPRKHHVYTCEGDRYEPVAHRSGDWIVVGHYEPDSKPSVYVEIHWPEDLEMSSQPDHNIREITTNNLPNHPTGEFPISRQDDGVRYQRNGNPVRLQDFSMTLPQTP
ncbi:MAG: hypothetical protein CMQ05_15390 [Gammaproteobacteria bacterium]|nr:hypothetical protein [Gammaproteobacteria bacterium]